MLDGRQPPESCLYRRNDRTQWRLQFSHQHPVTVRGSDTPRPTTAATQTANQVSIHRYVRLLVYLAGTDGSGQVPAFAACVLLHHDIATSVPPLRAGCTARNRVRAHDRLPAGVPRFSPALAVRSI